MFYETDKLIINNPPPAFFPNGQANFFPSCDCLRQLPRTCVITISLEIKPPIVEKSPSNEFYKQEVRKNAASLTEAELALFLIPKQTTETKILDN